MTLPEILETLARPTQQSLPAALHAAVERREEITPELLRVLRAWADASPDAPPDESHFLPLCTAMLLASFREKAAFEPMVRILAMPDDVPNMLFGDALPGVMDRILASVYDGQAALLESLVENPRLDEFVRATAMDAFGVLAHSGQIPRETVVEYLRALFSGRLERDYSCVWNSVVAMVAELPAPELLEHARAAVLEGITDYQAVDLDQVEEMLRSPNLSRAMTRGLIEDAYSELDQFINHGSDPMELDPEDPPAHPHPHADNDPLMPAAPRPKGFHPVAGPPSPGRNDPCPCGSGKKYKKCCG